MKNVTDEAGAVEVAAEAPCEDLICMDLPLDWENPFDGDRRTWGVHADSIPDGLILSLLNLGKVDIEYISSVTGEDYKTVISTLKGSIYQNPITWEGCFYKGWETADEYLSGNLHHKWKQAHEVNKAYPGYFADNLKAIEKVLPPAIASKDIYITLGSSWVPADVIDDFILHLLGEPKTLSSCWNPKMRQSLMESYKTIHEPALGIWEIPEKNRYQHSIRVNNLYGTPRMEALHILEKTLNMKSVTVMDEVSSFDRPGKKNYVINKGETISAVEKQKLIIQEFRDWVWKNKERKQRLTRIYDEKFASIRQRKYDGSFLIFPGMSPDISLPSYQKDAVARIIFSNNTLLAHDVGAGKTYIMIAAGQELRRMGLSSKNMYVVPNSIVGQWKDIYLSMYPDAKLLCVDPNGFNPEKRKKVLERMRDEDFDAIIIAYSCFDLIPLSKRYYIHQLMAERDKITKIMALREDVWVKMWHNCRLSRNYC